MKVSNKERQMQENTQHYKTKKRWGASVSLARFIEQ
jgi:hypothetical protein